MIEEAEIAKAAKAIVESPAAVKPRVNGKPPRAKYDVQPTDGFNLWEATVPESEPIIDGLLFANQLGILAGRPKIGKSMLALQAAIAIARGGTALGNLAVRRRGGVLYCDLENTLGTTQKRLRHLAVERDIYLQNLRLIRRLPKIREGGIEVLDEQLAAFPVQLVIIDTLAKLLAAEKGRDLVRSDYAEVDAIRRLSEKHQCGVLLVCHTRKMDADYALDAVQGTSGVTAAADYVLVLKHDGRGGHKLSLVGRDVESTDYAMTFEDGRWTVTGTVEDTDLSAARQEVLDLFRREGPGTTLAVEKISRLTGRPLPATHILVCRMCKEGLLDRAARGQYRATYPSI